MVPTVPITVLSLKCYSWNTINNQQYKLAKAPHMEVFFSCAILNVVY